VVVGDWNGDGRDTLGVRRGGTYYLKNSLSGGAADVIFAYGTATDASHTGDWNADAADTVGIRR
jgi:alkaline phosphatase